MKYYSEITKKLYDSEDELFKAEEEVTSAAKMKKERKAELDEMMAETRKMLDAYIKDYGSYYGKDNSVLRQLLFGGHWFDEE